MFRRVIANFVIPYGTYNTLFCLTTDMITLVTGLSILAGVSKFSFEYLLLPPRSAPAVAPPGLAARASARAAAACLLTTACRKLFIRHDMLFQHALLPGIYSQTLPEGSFLPDSSSDLISFLNCIPSHQLNNLNKLSATVTVVIHFSATALWFRIEFNTIQR